MNDEQKLKHQFSLHQDTLYWSRSGFLVTIQGGVLFWTYSLGDDPPVAAALVVLGIVLTWAVYLLMRRDDALGSQAFKQSGVADTPTNWMPRGRDLVLFVVSMLSLADIALLRYVLNGRSFVEALLKFVQVVG